MGKFFPNKLLSTIRIDSKGLIGMSNHNFEMSIINGLCQQNNINLKCISCPGVFSYPYHNKKLFTRSEHYDYRNTSIYSAGFCNLVGVKEFSSSRATAQILLQMAELCPDSTIHLIINTPDLRLFGAIKYAERKTSKHFTKTLIVPDIPSMITTMNKQNPIKKIILDKVNDELMHYTENCNGLVLLSEAMMNFIKKPVKHIVMEGVVDISSMDIHNIDTTNHKEVILYAGSLRKIFGIINLIEAFRLIQDQDIELWLCGSGDAKEEIEELIKGDPRIKFFGLVDSRTSLELQHLATILVNPRTSNGEYTKYSFPSKTIEYLLAGKSTIIYHLPSIPKEYYDYVYTPKNESVEAMASCISNVLHLNKKERKLRAEAGRRFIMEKKNAYVQMKRIINLIESYE